MFTYPWEHEHSPWLDILLGTGWQQKSNLCTLWLNLSNCSYACFWSTKKSCDCNLNFSHFNCLEINVALWFILSCNFYCHVINITLHLNHHCNFIYMCAYLNELRVYTPTQYKCSSPAEDILYLLATNWMRTLVRFPAKIIENYAIVVLNRLWMEILNMYKYLRWDERFSN